MICVADESIGYNQWMQMTNSFSSPKSPLKLIQTAYEELSTLSSHYKTLRRDLGSLMSSLESQKTGLQQMSSAFENWIIIEGSKLPQLNGSAINEAGKNVSLSNSLKSVAKTYTSDVAHIESKISGLKRIIHNDVSFEIASIASFRAELKADRRAHV